jgi:hypothetical protein
MSGHRDPCRAYRVAIHGLFIDRTLAVTGWFVEGVIRQMIARQPV